MNRSYLRHSDFRNDSDTAALGHPTHRYGTTQPLLVAPFTTHYSVVKRFDFFATSSEAAVGLLIEPAEARKKHAPPLLGHVYTFALKFLYNSTHSKDARNGQCKI